MNNDNRVLARQGAKELTPSEADHVVGGFRRSPYAPSPARGRRLRW